MMNRMKPVILLARGACGAAFLVAGMLWAVNSAEGGTPGKETTASAPARTDEQKKQENIERVMEFFRLTQPDVYEQANALKGSDPRKFDKLILSALPRVNELDSIRKTNPALFELLMRDLELGYQSLRLAHELKRTDLTEAERNKLTEQLRKIIAAEFGVQQQIRQFDIDGLRQKLKSLDDQVKAREADRESILQKRADDLINGTPRLEW